MNMHTSMTNQRVHLDTLKETIDLRNVAESILGQAHRRSRDYLQYRAPDREDRVASLTVWANGFKDFGRSENSGDVFTFLQLYGKMNFREAIRFLKADSPPSGKTTHATRHETRLASPDRDWQVAANRLLGQCQETLRLSPDALDLLMALGYSRELVEKRGLGLNLTWKKLNWRKPDGKPAWLPPGIVYPWYKNGQLYALKVRCPYLKADGKPDAIARLLHLKPEDAKYMQIAGGQLSQTWYGELENPAQPVILVEGEKDCDTLSQFLGQQANVLTLGSATGRIPADLVEKFRQVPFVCVVLDNDEAGRENADRLCRELSDQLGKLPVVTSARVPAAYKDVSDWILDGAGGLDYWYERLAERARELTIFRRFDPTTDTFFPQGMPDPLREVLLSLHHLAPSGRQYVKDHANAALVMDLYHELCIRQTLAGNAAFTLQHLHQCSTELGRGCDESALRRGLEQLAGIGVVELIANSTPSLSSEDLSKEQGGDSAKNSPVRRGRKAQFYRVRPIKQALAALLACIENRLREVLYHDDLPDHVQANWFDGLVNDEEQAKAVAEAVEQASTDLYEEHRRDIRRRVYEMHERLDKYRQNLTASALFVADSTLLPTEATYSSGREFRDVYYRALVEEHGARGRQIARAKAAAQIGVNSRTLGRIRQRVGVVTEACYECFPVNEPKRVHQRADRAAPWAREREFGRFLESSSGDLIRIDVNNTTSNDHWVATQMEAGHRVWIKIQVPSRERVATPEEMATLHVLTGVERKPCEKSGHGKVRPVFDAVTGERLPKLGVEAICPAGLVRGYISDQLRLRAAWLYPMIEANRLLCHVLVQLAVIAPRDFSEMLVES